MFLNDERRLQRGLWSRGGGTEVCEVTGEDRLLLGTGISEGPAIFISLSMEALASQEMSWVSW